MFRPIYHSVQNSAVLIERTKFQLAQTSHMVRVVAASLLPSSQIDENPPGPRVAGVYAVTTCFHVSCRLAVSDARVALPNFYNVTIGIADVAARLTVLRLWLRDKLGSSTPP
jgi:hypothetical protein